MNRRQRAKTVHKLNPAFPTLGSLKTRSPEDRLLDGVAVRAFPTLGSLKTRSRSLIVASALALICASPTPILAGPDQGKTGVAATAAQNVDYIGPETGASLDLGFPVMVPSWVPGPFADSPSVEAGGGYYSLYWMNAGGEPTFLQVTGQVGGALPAGSPYDLNVQLFINSSVQGYGAIHDVTPAYDTVWWIAGGVLYKVESRNSATDSVTLANSLIAFVPPSAAPEPEPEPEPTSPPPVVEEPEPVTSEPGSNSGGATTLPVDDGAIGGEDPADVTAESSDEDPAVVTAESSGEDPAVVTAESSGEEPADVAAESSGDATTDDDDITDDAVDDGDPGAGAPEAPDSGPDVEGSAGGTDTPDVTPVVASDGTGETRFSSDGTGGAQNLVIGSDGTGGTIEVIIPRDPTGRPTP